MTCSSYRFLLVATLLACGVGPDTFAQTALDPSSTAFPAPTAATERKNFRAVSPALAASLTASMPKYNPTKPAEKKPDDDDVDFREVDKPRNQIIRLPKYVVTGSKPPVFSERDIHTTKGLGRIAIKRYLSETYLALNSSNLPLFGLSNEARALAMYAEDERLQNMADLNDIARNASKTDPAAGTYIRRATQDTYIRASDFGWHGGPK